MNKQEIIEEFKELGYEYSCDGILNCFSKQIESNVFRIFIEFVKDDDCYIYSYDELEAPVTLTLKEAELAIEFAKIFKEENHGER